jgi:hypothetical protein
MALPHYFAAGLQVAMGYQQAHLMREQGDLNKAIADLNAKYKYQEAWEAETYGYSLSARYKVNEDKAISQQSAIFASQGVDTTSGTAKAIQEETRLIGFLNTLDIQKQARRKALGLKFDAGNIKLGGYTSQLQASSQATASQTASLFQGISTGISGYNNK